MVGQASRLSIRNDRQDAGPTGNLSHPRTYAGSDRSLVERGMPVDYVWRCQGLRRPPVEESGGRFSRVSRGRKR